VSYPVITFLSDYGLEDEFVGVCHGVIARHCPGARVIDISHAVPPRDVRRGALMLADALAYMPPGVHLAVVDPAVGATGALARRALAVRAAAAERVLVGPDNGLLVPALDRFGGAADAVEISGSSERLEPVSRTFHGRDVFAPVAAALAAGAALADVGEAIDASTLTRLELARAELRDGGLHAQVLYRDHFGNLVLNATREQAERLLGQGERAFAIATGGTMRQAQLAFTFADVAAGELLLYEDSNGALALAANGASAAALLNLEADSRLELRPA
jgi:S-adenosylmethionine hydrolase